MIKDITPLPDGTVYSKRKNYFPLASINLEDYTSIVGNECMEKLKRAAQAVEGLKLLELNATATGGGVAEILTSAIPFLNALGIEAEWRVISGNRDYFECTKGMHNLLQGMGGKFTFEMEQTYLNNLEACAVSSAIDYEPDVITVHDPQPLCLTHYLKKGETIWLWRCHIDIEDQALQDNPRLIDLMDGCIEHYDGAIFSAAHYVISRWPMPKFIIPPFIDPLSDKNRDLKKEEITGVLSRYNIDSEIPIVLQVGRFDPWKGIDRTIAAFNEIRKFRKCQLLIVGGLASDDPEGERILAQILTDVKDRKDIHVFNLPLKSDVEINAIQRAASVIMQPSTREGFGLVITEALWKGKPVIGSDVGGIPLQLRDGDTGYYYRSPQETAHDVIYLLDHPEEAKQIGNRGKEYVQEHFLMPARIADYLMAISVIINTARDKKLPPESIISFHPWFKLSKRRKPL